MCMCLCMCVCVFVCLRVCVCVCAVVWFQVMASGKEMASAISAVASNPGSELLQAVWYDFPCRLRVVYVRVAVWTTGQRWGT